MLDRSDALFLAIWFGLSLASLAGVYFCVRFFNWLPPSSSFVNAWKLWLVWLLSSYFVFPAGILLASKLGLLSYLSGFAGIAFFIFGSFLSGTVGVSVAIAKLSSRPRRLIGLANNQAPQPPSVIWSSRISQAVVTNLFAWGLAIPGVLVAGATFNLYEHFFPKAGPFAIYDIF